MTIISYTKPKYDDLASKVQKAILEFYNGNIIIDDSTLTLNEKLALDKFMAQNGFEKELKDIRQDP